MNKSCTMFTYLVFPSFQSGSSDVGEKYASALLKKRTRGTMISFQNKKCPGTSTFFTLAHVGSES